MNEGSTAKRAGCVIHSGENDLHPGCSLGDNGDKMIGSNECRQYDYGNHSAAPESKLAGFDRA